MKDVIDLCDRLENCTSKIAFLSDVFTQDECSNFHFSTDGITGFYHVLSNIRDDVEFVMNELRPRKEVEA